MIDEKGLVAKGSAGSKVERTGPSSWRLQIPAGETPTYRWAQLDDYGNQPRSRFTLRPPFTLDVRARVSQANLPGTWGFGLWNNPFTAELGIGGVSARFPALPNAAWFFHASSPNFLSFQDGLPAQGFLMAVFSSPLIPPGMLALGLPGLLLLAFRPAARWMRRLLGRIIQEDSATLEIDPTEWHEYRLELKETSCLFAVDGRKMLETKVVPRGRLGLVLWIDNQYAAFSPDGRLRSGALPNPQAWLELELR